MLEEAPVQPPVAVPAEVETAVGEGVPMLPRPRNGSAARDRGKGVRRGLRRAALSPCTWIVSAAFLIYWTFAYNEYMQQKVGACDLGIFYQAAEGWAFHLYPYVAIKGYPQIGDHFSPIYILLAPAMWIHNSPATLVFAQVVLLCLSGIPVYLAIRRVWGVPAASLLLIAYLFSIGMQGSIDFPVHEVMFSAPLIAWGIERGLAGRWTWACLLIGATAFVKEDMGMLIVMFAVWLAINRKWRHAGIMAVWGIVMFVLTVDVIIPHFNPNGFTYANDYVSTLHANTFGGEIKAVLLHPINTLHLVFGGEIKAQLWTHVLLPVAFMCVASPISLDGAALPGHLDALRPRRAYRVVVEPVLRDGADADPVHRRTMDGTNRIIGWIRAIAKWNEAKGLDWLGHRRFPAFAGVLLGLFALSITWGVTRTESLGIWVDHPSSYTAPKGKIQDVTEALTYIPSGVDVRATNNRRRARSPAPRHLPR